MNQAVRNRWKEVIQALGTDDLRAIKQMIDKELGE